MREFKLKSSTNSLKRFYCDFFLLFIRNDRKIHNAPIERRLLCFSTMYTCLHKLTTWFEWQLWNLFLAHFFSIRFVLLCLPFSTKACLPALFWIWSSFASLWSIRYTWLIIIISAVVCIRPAKMHSVCRFHLLIWIFKLKVRELWTIRSFNWMHQVKHFSLFI